MPEIENQIIEKSKRTISRSVAERESAIFMYKVIVITT